MKPPASSSSDKHHRYGFKAARWWALFEPGVISCAHRARPRSAFTRCARTRRQCGAFPCWPEHRRRYERRPLRRDLTRKAGPGAQTIGQQRMSTRFSGGGGGGKDPLRCGNAQGVRIALQQAWFELRSNAFDEIRPLLASKTASNRSPKPIRVGAALTHAPVTSSMRQVRRKAGGQTWCAHSPIENPNRLVFATKRAALARLVPVDQEGRARRRSSQGSVAPLARFPPS